MVEKINILDLNAQEGVLTWEEVDYMIKFCSDL